MQAEPSWRTLRCELAELDIFRDELNSSWFFSPPINSFLGVLKGGAGVALTPTFHRIGKKYMYLPPTPTLQRVLFKIRDAEVQVLGLGWLFTFVNWFAYFKIKPCCVLFKIRNTELQVLGLSRVCMIFMIYSSMSWIFRTRAGFLEPELAQKLPKPSWAKLKGL